MIHKREQLQAFVRRSPGHAAHIVGIFARPLVAETVIGKAENLPVARLVPQFVNIFRKMRRPAREKIAVAGMHKPKIYIRVGSGFGIFFAAREQIRPIQIVFDVARHFVIPPRIPSKFIHDAENHISDIQAFDRLDDLANVIFLNRDQP